MKLREKESEHLTPLDLAKYLSEDMPQQAIVSAFRKYSK